ncbi:related to Cytochrome P450 [Melanopsichium pennsylvanicum]|uniref:Related to Cytochrome P450 n=2 Tax=Melanopsichium pennsylvanicum TaxID=63383 RepID=A0AAJ4XKX1_9BASI|nr:related to Cytochrome P450 [Melanopsichium pennsylvanicum 4]SNX82988.1 related to Cytochrome P450 [Melanopsichium pennsylvanicum]
MLLPTVQGSFEHLTPTHIAIGSVLVLTLLCLVAPDRYIFASHRKGIKEVPNALPLIGNFIFLLDIASKRRRFLDEFLRMQLSIGAGGQPWAATFPYLGGRVTSINRPEYIRWVQKTNFENYIKGPFFQKSMGDVMSTHGIFVADGEIWRKQRKMASHIFSVGNFRTHVQTTIQRDLSVLNKLFQEVSKKNVEVNLPDLFFRFTLSSFSLMAFSADIKCLPSNVAELDKVVEFAANFDYAQRVMDERFVDPLSTFTEMFSFQGRKMRKTIKQLHNFCYEIIDLRLDARARGEAQAASGKGDKDLLALFMEQNLERDELLPVVLNFLIAGRDTTAQALGWLFYEFSKKPETVEKARQEIHDKLGAGADFRSMAYDDLSSLVYVQACFLEALRLHPSVPKNLKLAVKDDVIRPYAQPRSDADVAPNAVACPQKLPDLIIKKGETVTWQDHTMARMPELWGKDCEQFKPERFIEKRDDGSICIKTYSQYLFHAFNAGPRLCLGQTLATYEGCAVVAEILGNFNVKFDQQALRNDEPTYDDSLTLPIKNPYKVRVQARDE